MNAAAPSLKRFVLLTFLWLPVCFAAWYAVSPYHAALAGKLAKGLVNTISTGVVAAIEHPARDLVFVTTLQVHPAPGQTAVLVPEVNPLLYTYGIALFLALMLAEQARWWKVLVGASVLLLFQSWGIAFDLLAQIGIKLGPDVSAQAGLAGWHLEAIALGYQLGTLIFPCLVPIVLWASWSQWLREAAPALRLQSA